MAEKENLSSLAVISGEIRLTQTENKEGDFVRIDSETGKLVTRTSAEVRTEMNIPDEMDQDNIVRVLQINAEELSGNGTILEQVAEYLNSLSIEIVETTSKLNIEVIGVLPDEDNNVFPYSFPYNLA